MVNIVLVTVLLLLMYVWSVTALEKMLPATCGKYCVGDSVTIADVCLVCYSIREDVTSNLW